MVEPVEITNKDSAHAWLETQDHQTQVWFATRCALRAVPASGNWRDATSSGLAFASFRATLISAAAATCPAAEMKELTSSAHSADSALSAADSAHSAALSAHSAALSAHSAAHSAALSAHSADSALSAAHSAALSAHSAAHSAAWRAISFDANAAGNWEVLWPDASQPEKLGDAWIALKAQWDKDGADWSFWITWYEAILNGHAMDWDLTRRIALEITKQEWDAGQTVVAERIKEIQTDNYTAVSPPLVQLENGIWDVAPDASIPEEPIEFAIAQVEINLAAALGSGSHNGLTETSGETILIRMACTTYRGMPSVVATSFWNACMELDRNIGNVYPEDAILISLKNVLYTSVEELCQQSSLIRNRVGKLAALETQRMPTAQERTDLRAVPAALADDMTPRALEQLSEAVNIVADTENPPRLFRARLVNWLNKIGSAIDTAQKHDKRATWLVKLVGRIVGWFFRPTGGGGG